MNYSTKSWQSTFHLSLYSLHLPCQHIDESASRLDGCASMSLICYRAGQGCRHLYKKRKAAQAKPNASITPPSSKSAVSAADQVYIDGQRSECEPAKQQRQEQTYALSPSLKPPSAAHSSSSHWKWTVEPEPNFDCLIERIGRTKSNKHFLEQFSQPSRRVRYKIHADGHRERDTSMSRTLILALFGVS